MSENSTIVNPTLEICNFHEFFVYIEIELLISVIILLGKVSRENFDLDAFELVNRKVFAKTITTSSHNNNDRGSTNNTFFSQNGLIVSDWNNNKF